jgi:hypothetical protein
MRRTAFLPMVALVLSATNLGAQITATATERKSPTTARLIGVVPGAGHVYAGETRRGLAYLGGTAGLLVLGGVVLAAGCMAEGLANASDPDCPSPVVENVFVGAVLGLWGWSIYDAGRAAHRTNARRGLRASLIVAPTRSPASNRRDRSAVRLGLSVGAR